MALTQRGCTGITLAAMLVLGLLISPGHARATPIYWEGNGHYYEIFTFDTSQAWMEAYLEARDREYEGMSGYLATLTSAEENEFVGSTFAGLQNYALGGYQLPGSLEPAGGWAWITGELFAYQNWISREPNNMGGEDYLIIGYTDNRQWNDGLWTYGGIVEYGGGFTVGPTPGSTPEPTTALLFASATGLVAFFRRRSRKE